MRKSFLLIVTVFMVLTLTSVAFGANGPYIGANIGAAFLDSSNLGGAGELYYYNGGSVVNLVGGYSMGPIRVEGELGHAKSEIHRISSPTLGTTKVDNGSATSSSIMLNGYIDLFTLGRLTPYISGGVGYTKLELKDINLAGSPVSNGDDTVFAYQVGCGVGFELSKEIMVDLKYRYFTTEDPDFSGVASEYKNHQVLLGVRYSF